MRSVQKLVTQLFIFRNVLVRKKIALYFMWKDCFVPRSLAKKFKCVPFCVVALLLNRKHLKSNVLRDRFCPLCGPDYTKTIAVKN